MPSPSVAIQVREMRRAAGHMLQAARYLSEPQRTLQMRAAGHLLAAANAFAMQDRCRDAWLAAGGGSDS